MCSALYPVPQQDMLGLKEEGQKAGLLLTSNYVSRGGHIGMLCFQLAVSQGAGRAGLPPSQPVRVLGPREEHSSAVFLPQWAGEGRNSQDALFTGSLEGCGAFFWRELGLRMCVSEQPDFIRAGQVPRCPWPHPGHLRSCPLGAALGVSLPTAGMMACLRVMWGSKSSSSWCVPPMCC